MLCSDYLKGLLTERVLRAVFAASEEHGIPSIVAPKDKNSARYRGASILVPNLRELSQLVETQVDGGAWLSESARNLSERLHLEALVVTRGSEGMTLFDGRNGDLRQVDIPTMARSVYDVTGAGDTAIAAFGAAIAAGADRETAVRLANLAAGIKVGKRGTATVNVDEIKKRLCEDDLLF
jgi:D-beta-D-heptose 7-phosphate kinase/D-beta-D-heptose 1-phosphate adenosyltransferase